MSRIRQILDSTQTSQFIRISASSGIGKTRFLQELYNHLAAESKYWKIHNVRNDVKEAETITLVREDSKEIDFLFFSARASFITSCRNEYDFCFDRVRHQFAQHIPSIIRRIEKKNFNKTLTRSVIGVMLNLTLPGSTQTIELINTLRGIYCSSESIVNFIENISDRFTSRKSNEENTTYNYEIANLVQLFVNVFQEVNNLSPIQTIIVIDDIHWVDAFSVQIIKSLHEASIQHNWNITFILAGWEDASFCDNQHFNQNYIDLLSYIETNAITIAEIELSAIHQTCIQELIHQRFPNFDSNAIDIIHKRCNGDIDMLNDLLNKIHNTPGWLNNEGRLQVDCNRINNLPLVSVELIRQGLALLPSNIRNILYYASLQGIVFDEHIIVELMKQRQESEHQAELLHKIERNYGLLWLKSASISFNTFEFKKVALYEACFGNMSSHPDIEMLKADLVQIIIDLTRSSTWNMLSSNNKDRVISLLITMEEYICSENQPYRETLILDYFNAKLNLGDYLSVQRKLHILDPSKFTNIDRYYAILTSSYFLSGDIAMETALFKKWEEETKHHSIFYLKYSQFLRRTNNVAMSLNILSKVERGEFSPHDFAAINREKAIALWSMGKAYDAFERVLEMEKTLDKSDKVALKDYHRASGLILHDLDKNRQVSVHTDKCVRLYEELGDIQETLIMKVNYADSLWGLSYQAKSIETLRDIIKRSIDYKLPHVTDIAHLCLANALATSGNTEEAFEHYNKGIALANEISHSWDILYGELYKMLLEINTSSSDSSRDYASRIHALHRKSIVSNHHYLKELFEVLDLYSRFKSKKAIERNHTFTFPASKMNYLAIQYHEDKDKFTQLDSFISILAECEGCKFNKIFIFNTITEMLDKLEMDCYQRATICDWLYTYNLGIENEATLKIKVCDYKVCEARCCYDGVYLVDNKEKERIEKVVEENAEFFSFLPENFIIKSSWNGGKTAYKTATKEHHYKRKDYPKHFENTRCVFADDDGACLLQDIAIAQGISPYTYKPAACCLYPLRSHKSKIQAPYTSLDKDQHFLGLEYPGYASYTPCGINQINGKNWKVALSGEIDLFKKLFGCTDDAPA